MRQILRHEWYLIPLFATGLSWSEGPQTHSITDAGRSLVAAINTGDRAKLSEFVSKSFSDAALRRNSLDDYVEALEKLFLQSGGLDIVEELPTGNSNTVRFKLHARTVNRWMTIGTRWDQTQPGKLDGIGFSLIEDPTTSQWPTGILTLDEALTEVQSHVERAASEDRFSGVVLIGKGDEIIFQKTCGFSDQENEVPNSVTTKFNLGSMNKMFTSVAIAQLVQAGKLSYDDTVLKRLPEYPNKLAASQIRISQLLTHTSGLGDFFTPKFFADTKRFRTPMDYIPVFGPDPLLFEPGASWRYSNFGFVVLGAIIERASGEDYFDYIRNHIYKPAGMNDSDTFSVGDSVTNQAVGYTRFGGRGLLGDDPLLINTRRRNTDTKPWRGSPAGGGYASAPDLFSFARALRTYKLLNKELTEKITAGMVNAPFGQYGFGFEVHPADDARGHSGGAQGINSDLMILWDKGLTIVITGNYDPPAAQELGNQIASFLAHHVSASVDTPSAR